MRLSEELARAVPEAGRRPSGEVAPGEIVPADAVPVEAGVSAADPFAAARERLRATLPSPDDAG